MPNNIWNCINNISTIISLILFLLFIIGRIWTILQRKNIIDEELDTEFKEHFKIIESFDIGLNTEEKIYLTAKHTLVNVKVYECKLKKNGKLKKAKTYVNCGDLRNGFTFQFNTYLVEGVPRFLLEYQSNDDYTKGQLLFIENGRNGIIEQNIHKKHTFKSVIYYFCKWNTILKTNLKIRVSIVTKSRKDFYEKSENYCKRRC